MTRSVALEANSLQVAQVSAAIAALEPAARCNRRRRNRGGFGAPSRPTRFALDAVTGQRRARAGSATGNGSLRRHRRLDRAQPASRRRGCAPAAERRAQVIHADCPGPRRQGASVCRRQPAGRLRGRRGPRGRSRSCGSLRARTRSRDTRRRNQDRCGATTFEPRRPSRRAHRDESCWAAVSPPRTTSVASPFTSPREWSRALRRQAFESVMTPTGTCAACSMSSHRLPWPSRALTSRWPPTSFSAPSRGPSGSRLGA